MSEFIENLDPLGHHDAIVECAATGWDDDLLLERLGDLGITTSIEPTFDQGTDLRQAA